MALTFDTFLSRFRELGRYQLFAVLLLTLPATFMNAYNGYGLVFLAYTPLHTCLQSEGIKLRPDLHYLQVQETAARLGVRSEECFLSRNSTGTEGEASARQPCTRWAYNDEYFDETLITKFDLVCSREIEAKTMLSLVGGVAVVGCLFFAWVSDRWGRKFAFLFNVGMYVAGAVTALFMPNLIGFTIIRFIASLNAISSWNVGYVWGLEFTGSKYRTVVTTVFTVLYAVAMVSMSFIGWLCRTWVQMGLVISLPFVLLISYRWLVSESPQWLLSAGKEAEATDVVERMLKWEKCGDKEALRVRSLFQVLLTSPPDLVASERECKPVAKTTMLDLFRGRELRMKTLLVCLCFVSNCVVYTSIAYNTENLGGNLYLTWAIQSAVEAPATILNIFLLNRFGRVRPLAIGMAISGICCLLTAPGDSLAEWVVLTLAFVGKFSICSSYAVIYQLTGELMPTVVRSQGVGLAAVVGESGNIIMPFIIYASNAYRHLPMLIIGALSVVGGAVALFIPETNGRPLPQSLPEAEETTVGFHTLKRNLGCTPLPEPVSL